jgi:UDP-glucose 4-epimerase
MGKYWTGGVMSVSNRRVLVTGGAGFIGSHLVDKLVELNWRVTVLDNLSFGYEEQVNKRADFVRLDVCDYSSLRNVTSDTNPRLIFHLAANATTKESAMGWQNPVADYQVNAMGTLNILRAVVDLGIDCHVIYASSAAIYGEPEYTPIDESHPTNPISPYGISKLAGEKYCLAYFREQRVKTTILRIFNTYGPRQPRYIMFDLVKKLSDDANKLEVLGTGKQVRDYCYVSDTVNAFILAAENSAWGKIYNVAGGNPISISEVVRLIVATLGLGTKTEIHYTGESWKGDIFKLSADISKIKRELGFEPQVSLEEGLQRFIRWLRNND